VNYKSFKTKQMETLLLRLFGQKPANQPIRPNGKFNSSFPKEQLTFHEWVKQYNVSMLWDRRTIKID
jgi:hypothetical protein